MYAPGKCRQESHCKQGTNGLQGRFLFLRTSFAPSGIAYTPACKGIVDRVVYYFCYCSPEDGLFESRQFWWILDDLPNSTHIDNNAAGFRDEF